VQTITNVPTELAPSPPPDKLPPLNIHSRQRFLRISWFFLQVIVHVFFFDILLGRLGITRWYVRRTAMQRWVRIARGFRGVASQMGGVLIKLGQFLSSRADVLPVQITDELSGLQDEVPPSPLAYVLATIVEDLGAREYLRDDLTMNVQRGLLSVVGRPSAAQRNVWRNFRSWPRRQRSLRRRIVDPILTHAIATGFEKRPFDPGSWAIPWSPGALAVLACLLPSAVRAGSRRFTRRYRYSTLAPGGADRRVSST